jgi:chorismate mutase/prephenate dehydratase
MKKRIGYLGIPGSYSHTAAKKYFSESDKEYDLKGFSNFTEVFEFASDNSSHFGVIPIENTLAGSIYENYDHLDVGSLNIVGEYYLRIEHHLLVPKGAHTKVSQIKQIYSHPKAIEQCAQFLKNNPQIHVNYTSDTANAAKYVSETNDMYSAAISSKECENLYNLDTIPVAIANNSENFTRFLILSKQPSQKEANKASLAIHLSHKTGSMARVLNILASNNCNLTKIESRPLIGKPLEYIFYLDFQYNSTEHKITEIVEQLSDSTTSAKLVGLYKSGKFGS